MVKYKGYTTLEVLEGADRYNKWIAESIAPYIKPPALEIGAGTGNISCHFLNKKALVVSDSDPELVKILSKKFSKDRNVRAEIINIEKKSSDNKEKFKTVYSVNVLEHIKDDILALKNMHELLDKGGRVILLVPAKKRAYTNLDKKLGHFRRYEKKELLTKLEEAGFEVEKIRFFNMLGLLSWIVRDKVSRDHTQLRPYQIRLFDSVVPILRRIEPASIIPVGISLIAVAKKI